MWSERLSKALRHARMATRPRRALHASDDRPPEPRPAVSNVKRLYGRSQPSTDRSARRNPSSRRGTRFHAWTHLSAQLPAVSQCAGYGSLIGSSCA
jgi:hypothetical protein